MRKILITNDDGIFAEGLIRLVKTAQKFGEVWVVAPDGQRSGASHSVHLHSPIEAWKVDFPVEGITAYACNGMPADCVRIGVLNIIPGGPDVVFSGINFGYNLASDIQYSATAGAAFEASFQGLQSFAFSEGIDGATDVTNRYLEEIIETLLVKPHGPNQIWNVNFPECELKNCRGILWDRKVYMGVFYADKYKETVLTEDRSSFMVEGERNWNADDGTDLGAILDNYVSVGLVTNIS